MDVVDNKVEPETIKLLTDNLLEINAFEIDVVDKVVKPNTDNWELILLFWTLKVFANAFVNDTVPNKVRPEIHKLDAEIVFEIKSEVFVIPDTSKLVVNILEIDNSEPLILLTEIEFVNNSFIDEIPTISLFIDILFVWIAVVDNEPPNKLFTDKSSVILTDPDTNNVLVEISPLTSKLLFKLVIPFTYNDAVDNLLLIFAILIYSVFTEIIFAYSDNNDNVDKVVIPETSNEPPNLEVPWMNWLETDKLLIIAFDDWIVSVCKLEEIEILPLILRLFDINPILKLFIYDVEIDAILLLIVFAILKSDDLIILDDIVLTDKEEIVAKLLLILFVYKSGTDK